MFPKDFTDDAVPNPNQKTSHLSAGEQESKPSRGKGEFLLCTVVVKTDNSIPVEVGFLA